MNTLNDELSSAFRCQSRLCFLDRRNIPKVLVWASLQDKSHAYVGFGNQGAMHMLADLQVSMAVGAIAKARAMGLDVPNDDSITGFDDIELAQRVSNRSCALNCCVRPRIVSLRLAVLSDTATTCCVHQSYRGIRATHIVADPETPGAESIFCARIPVG